MLEDFHRYRFERKFLISGFHRSEVETVIKQQPGMFREIFCQRYVNNIYFDSIDMSSYFTSVNGTTSRIKIRIRWYGELFANILKPMLELKIKHGLLGRKESFPLKEFNFARGGKVYFFSGIFKDSNLPKSLVFNLNYFKPVLLNRYSRKYYQTVDRDFRITLDSEMVYYHITGANNWFIRRSADLNNVVLELKYDKDKDHHADSIISRFPFRLTKNSKFVNGIKRVYEI